MCFVLNISYESLKHIRSRMWWLLTQASTWLALFSQSTRNSTGAHSYLSSTRGWHHPIWVWQRSLQRQNAVIVAWECIPLPQVFKSHFLWRLHLLSYENFERALSYTNHLTRAYWKGIIQPRFITASCFFSFAGDCTLEGMVHSTDCDVNRLAGEHWCK